MSRERRSNTLAIVLAWLGLGIMAPSPARAAAEVKVDRDFLAGIVEKLPPAPFAKDGQYRGEVRRFRLAGIDPKTRRLMVACEVAGEFRAPLAAALKAKPTASGSDWKSFLFDVKVGVRAEPGPTGVPKFAVDVEEVKRREMEGVAGTLAKVLGRFFDDTVTQVADGKAALLNSKLNAEVMKRAEAFRQYGVLREVEYTPDALVLRFDVTRLKAQGLLGFILPGPPARPPALDGVVPLHRWHRPRIGDHFYITNAEASELPARGYVYEGVVGFVFDRPSPGTTAVHRWRSRREPFYTIDPTGAGLSRQGYRPETVAFHLYDPALPPPPGAVPFYQFVDPRNGLHFYTTHPHAEFAK